MWRRRVFTSVFFAVLILFVVGSLIMSANLYLAKRSLLVKAADSRRPVHISGMVIGEPKMVKGGIRFELQAEEARIGRERWSIDEKTMVFIKPDWRRFEAGQFLSLTSIPRIPKSKPNFNYQAYLARRGIFTELVLSAEEITVKKDSAGVGDNFRRRLRHIVRESMPRPLGGILLAILFGDTAYVPETIKINFERAGILHLFAVSGLNLTLAVAFVFWLSRAFRLPPLIRLLSSLTAVFFYLWLVESTPSINRAALMSIVLLFSWYLARRLDLLASVSLAAIILLAINPYQLFDISFQLSFGAVLGILMISPVVINVFKEKIRKLVAPAAVTLGAQLAVQPIIAYYFNQLSVVSILANMALVPPVALVTGIGFLAAALALISRPAAALLFTTLTPLVSYLNFGAAFFANLPGAVTTVARPSVVAIIFYAAMLIFALYGLSKWKSRADFGTFLIALLLILTLGIWSQVPVAVSPSGLRVSFLDVGQGDATLIKSPNGQVILVDGAPDFPTLQRGLADRGVRKIDLLVISHAHADHIGGLTGLLQRYPVGLIIDPGFAHPSPLYKELLLQIKEKGIKYRIARKGDEYSLGAVNLKIFLPGDFFVKDSNSDVNNSSIVGRLIYGEFRLLLPGDIELEAIDLLLKGSEDLTADVLRTAHHGSRTGTTVPLLRAVKPKEAIISSGKENPYGHPHRQALIRLKAAGVRYWRTDINGDIELRSDGKSYRIWAEK